MIRIDKLKNQIVQKVSFFSIHSIVAFVNMSPFQTCSEPPSRNMLICAESIVNTIEFAPRIPRNGFTEKLVGCVRRMSSQTGNGAQKYLHRCIIKLHLVRQNIWKGRLKILSEQSEQIYLRVAVNVIGEQR